jgi:hypothetical protein
MTKVSDSRRAQVEQFVEGKQGTTRGDGHPAGLTERYGPVSEAARRPVSDLFVGGFGDTGAGKRGFEGSLGSSSSGSYFSWIGAAFTPASAAALQMLFPAEAKAQEAAVPAYETFEETPVESPQSDGSTGWMIACLLAVPLLAAALLLRFFKKHDDAISQWANKGALSTPDQDTTGTTEKKIHLPRI